MNKFLAWLIGGLAGLATFVLLPFPLLLLTQLVAALLALEAPIQEKIIVGDVLVSLIAAVTVGRLLPSWLVKRFGNTEPPRTQLIRFVCSHCGAQNTVAEHCAGQQVACGQCRQSTVVPIVAATIGPSAAVRKSRWIAVVAILALVVIVLPVLMTWFASFRRILAERENESRTIVNMKLIMNALHSYHQDHGRFPPAVVKTRQGKPLYSWRALILPYLGEKELAERFHYDEPWDSANNKALLDEMPSVFRSGFESQRPKRSTSYLLIAGYGSVFAEKSASRLEDISDGAANTACLAEVLGSRVEWTRPTDLDLALLHQTGMPQGDFPVMLNSWQRISRVAMFDGSVIVPDPSIDAEAWTSACLPNDGN